MHQEWRLSGRGDGIHMSGRIGCAVCAQEGAGEARAPWPGLLHHVSSARSQMGCANSERTHFVHGLELKNARQTRAPISIWRLLFSRALRLAPRCHRVRFASPPLLVSPTDRPSALRGRQRFVRSVHQHQRTQSHNAKISVSLPDSAQNMSGRWHWALHCTGRSARTPTSAVTTDTAQRQQSQLIGLNTVREKNGKQPKHTGDHSHQVGNPNNTCSSNTVSSAQSAQHEKHRVDSVSSAQSA